MSESIVRYTEIHDWRFLGCEVDSNTCLLRMANPTNTGSGMLNLTGVQSILLEVWGRQAIVSALEEYRVNEGNLDRALDHFSKDAGILLRPIAIGKKLLTIDFHVGMSVICLCQDFTFQRQ